MAGGIPSIRIRTKSALSRPKFGGCRHNEDSGANVSCYARARKSNRLLFFRIFEVVIEVFVLGWIAVINQELPVLQIGFTNRKIPIK